MGDRIEENMNKEDSYRILEMVNSWIHAADNKASKLLAFITIFIGLTFSMISEIKDIFSNLSGVWLVIVIILVVIGGSLYLFLVTYVFYNLIHVFIARINHDDICIKNNLTSFISISNMNPKDYTKLAKKTDNQSLYTMLLEQININSKIAKAKMEYFNKSLKYSVILVVLSLFTILIISIFV